MILIALGANLPGLSGSALDACREATRRLAASPLLAFQAVSSWYETAPDGVGASGPPYVNGVARFAATDALRCAADAPAALLAALGAIEASAGRTRTTPNAPRTLDLDLISMSGPISTSGLVRDAPDPILPHPRAHLRRFVLVPLDEVAPAWRHPVLGLSAAALLARLVPDGGIRRLAEVGTDD